MKMPPRKVRKVTIYILFLLFALTILGVIIENSLITTLSSFLVMGTVVLYLLFYRCHNCGKFLGRDNAKYCPHCGKEVE